MYMQDRAERERQIDLMPSGKRTFVGRKDFLRKLDHWYSNPRSPFLQVIADGGTGKTSLVYHWLRNAWCLDAEGSIAPPTVAVHSFYGQAKSGRTSVDEALVSLFKALLGPSEHPPLSSDLLIAGIVEACSQRPAIIILDGFETQQDQNGLIEVEYLLMEELFLRLADSENCKLIITSRRRLDRDDLPEYSSLMEVSGLELDDLFDLFTIEFPQGDHGRLRARIAKCFPQRTQALVAALALNALVEAGSLDALMEIAPRRQDIEPPPEGGVPRAVSLLVERSYHAQTEAAQFILRLIALSDEDVSRCSGEALATNLGRTWSQSAFDKLAAMRLVIYRERGLEMHPRVRECIATLAKRSDNEDFRAISIALAERSEAWAARRSDRREALSEMHRAIIYRLRAGDLRTALERNYFGFFSAEPNTAGPTETIVWRSIKKDLAYALENETLDILETAVFEACTNDPTMHDALLELKRRQLYVCRSIGLIEKADEIGMELADADEMADASSDGAMTAQTILTKLIKGQVDNPPEDVRGASYWSKKAITSAANVAPRVGLLPEIRAQVYQGALFHRLNRFEEALSAFERATDLQRKLHESNPSLPPCLMGLNIFLFLWFLIDSRGFDRAEQVVADVNSVLVAMDSDTRSAHQMRQWRLMLTVPEAWLRQEQALNSAEHDRPTEAFGFMRRSNRLLSELRALNDGDRWAIPYDMRAVYVRTELRRRILSQEIDAAVAELKHRVRMYERSHATLFAADCQGDLLRFYTWAHNFPNDIWTYPAPSVVLSAAEKLRELSIRYPMVQHTWYLAAPLQRMRAIDIE